MASPQSGPAPGVPRVRYLLLLGLGATGAMVVALAAYLGGFSALLTVGESEPISSLIQEELPDVTVYRNAGHDGQYFYAIARDPFASGPARDLLDDASYRYRRIGFPLLAGGLGAFSPEVTVGGMLILAIAGYGVTVAATYRLSGTDKLPFWAAPLAAASLPALLSVRFLLADSLALGLALLGVMWFLEGRDKAALWSLALAALTKESYLVMSLALGLSIITNDWHSPASRRRAAWYLLAPALPVAAWSSLVMIRLGRDSQGLSNFGWPFDGIADSIAKWDQSSASDIAFAIVAIALMALAISVAALLRDRWWAWLMIPWVAVLIFSSEQIWGFGNNALRVAAPLWTFGILGLGTYVARTSRRNLPV